MTIRIGVLGAGRIGKIHCATLLSMGDEIALAAVCDPHLDHAWARTLFNAKCFINEDDFFRCDLDAVVIASPTTKHFAQVISALDRGMHALCEKPLSFSLPEHRTVKQKLAEKKRVLQFGFNRRFDLDFQKIAELNHQAKLGTPYFLRITSRDPALPTFDYLRSSGGMFMDMTIHDFDMARFVMRSEVSEVFAYGARLIDKRLAEINDIDTALITLKFENGAFGVIDNSRQAIYGYDQRLELFGSLGSATNENHRPLSIERNDAEGSLRPPIKNFFLDRYALSYRREMMAFISSIRKNTPCTPNIHDAEMAVRLALCAEESLFFSRPVKVKSSL